MNITFDFATKDDCLDKMVPSDLRKLVAERDQLQSRVAELEDISTTLLDLAFDAYPRSVAEEFAEVLARTPCQSLARVRAQALREAARDLTFVQSGISLVATENLIGRAQRLEQEAQDDM